MKDLQVSCGTMHQMTPSTTLAITAKANAMKAAGEKVVGMSAGEPDFDTPSVIVDACIAALKKGMTRYTPSDGSLDLRKAIVEKFAKDNGIKTTPQQIIVSPGAKYSIFLAVCALCGPGDEVLLPAPYWLSYPEIIKSSGAKMVPVPTKSQDNYEVDMAVLKSLVTDRTKLMILTTPSNPTGAVYTKEKLQAIADLAIEKNFMILSDEIYEKLVFDDHLPHVSIGSLNEKIADLTVTVNGFSKSYAMTGWRLGYLTAPLWLAKRISALQSHSTSNATSFAQAGALAALQHAEEDVKKMCAIFAKRRDLIYSLFCKIPGLKCNRPQGAFYIFCDISSFGLSSTEFCARLLEEEKIACVPCADFSADNCIRLSYACSDADIAFAAEALTRFCAKLA